MIRNFIWLLFFVVGLSACATDKTVRSQQAFSPANFTIDEVTIDVVTEDYPSRDFMRLMRKAAKHTKEAYNEEAGDNRGVYNLEFSLEALNLNVEDNSPSGVSENRIELTVTLRNPESGVAMRSLPVRYRLERLDLADTREKQLLRAAMALSFDGIYGRRKTPESVAVVIRTEELFTGEKPRPQAPIISKPAAVEVTPEVVSDTPSVEATEPTGDPQIITCSVC